jgi:ComF family protein
MNPRSAVSGSSQVVQLGRHAWRGLVHALFPPRCGGCQAEGCLWCDACQARLVYVLPPMCDKCGEPNVAGLCVNCRAQPLRIEIIRSVAIFHGPLRHAIHRFKYERLAGLAAPFGDLLADFWLAHDLHADWIVPVPLHPARQRERGYNQSELLADRLAQRIGVPLARSGLQRIRVTAVQMELNAAQRKVNVAGAFECAERQVRGRRVAIIDDVCTTGATLDACAAAVLKAGAASALGLTLARTP